MRYIYTFDDGEDYEYEPEIYDKINVLSDLVIEDYEYYKKKDIDKKSAKDLIKFMIKECDLVEILENEFEDAIKDRFEDEALEDYREYKDGLTELKLLEIEYQRSRI